MDMLSFCGGILVMWNMLPVGLFTVESEPSHFMVKLVSNICKFKEDLLFRLCLTVFSFLSSWYEDMPSSQPIDIPDAKKRNKKKKRCRATDSFSGRFEGECQQDMSLFASVCTAFVMLCLFNRISYSAFRLVIFLMQFPLSDFLPKQHGVDIA